MCASGLSDQMTWSKYIGNESRRRDRGYEFNLQIKKKGVVSIEITTDLQLFSTAPSLDYDHRAI